MGYQPLGHNWVEAFTMSNGCFLLFSSASLWRPTPSCSDSTAVLVRGVMRYVLWQPKLPPHSGMLFFSSYPEHSQWKNLWMQIVTNPHLSSVLLGEETQCVSALQSKQSQWVLPTIQSSFKPADMRMQSQTTDNKRQISSCWASPVSMNKASPGTPRTLKCVKGTL